MEWVQTAFNYIVQASIMLLEGIGVAVLVITAVRSVIHLIAGKPHVKTELAEGTALALEFKLGSEVLRTVIVRTWSELAILGAIVLLRAAITFLIHWSLKSERELGDA